MLTTVVDLCDDFFIQKNLSISDLYTPIYGPVFRLQRNLLVTPDELLTKPVGARAEGEWPSLGYANWLISARFGETSAR